MNKGCMFICFSVLLYEEDIVGNPSKLEVIFYFFFYVFSQLVSPCQHKIN